MKKEKFHISLITNTSKEEYNLLGKYDRKKNIISYYESNSLRSKIDIDIDNHLLIKENIDYKITLNLDEKSKTEGVVFLKKEKKLLILKIETTEFTFINNKLSMIYTIVDSKEEIKYEIEIGD